jgi:hypothetical protein
MPRRLLSGAIICLSVFLCLLPSARAADEPRFLMGFRLLADMIPEIAGQPLEDERHNALNGDGLQMTTRGLMVWRKADNWTAFTNGWWTWVNGPYGLQDRANYERFEWEADSEAFPAVPDERIPPAPEPSPDPAVAQTPVATMTVELPPPTSQPSATAFIVPTPAPTAQPTSTQVPTSTAVPTLIPTQTPYPTSTTAPTSTSKPTGTPQPASTVRPTATQVTGGVRSPDPAGNWVTSVSSSTRYYCSRSSSYWQSWTAGNRIWFQTEAALLAAYPTRVKHN